MGFSGGPEAVLMQLKLGNRIEIYIVVVGKKSRKKKTVDAFYCHVLRTQTGSRKLGGKS